MSGFFAKSFLRNQQRYYLAKREQLIKVVSPLPKYTPSWRHILEVVLPIRDCLKRIENQSESTQVIEIRNLLIKPQEKLQKLQLPPTPFQGDMKKYLEMFDQWLINIVDKIAKGNFS